MPNAAQNSEPESPRVRISAPTPGQPLNIGGGFTGRGFRYADFSGQMDPLVMVDHYVMTQPTFGVHPHAGMSAVSVIFEDSEGEFHNRDSLGSDFDLLPGDLYWLKAGKGAIHDESPRDGAKIHGLQLFVNLPAPLKQAKPESLRVKSAAMPIIESEGVRVRLVLGKSNGVQGADSPVLPFTILDAKISSGANFAHALPGNHSAWLYAVKQGIIVETCGEQVHLAEGESIAITSDAGLEDINIGITGSSGKGNHFVLLAGERGNEEFVHQGPFVMSNAAELQQVIQDHQAGKLGSI